MDPFAGQDNSGPKVRLSRKAVKINSRRVGALRDQLPARERDGCHITVALKRNGRTIAKKKMVLAGGESRLAKLKLSRNAYTALRKRGKLRVRALVTARDGAGNQARLAVTLTLKAPRLKR